MGLKEVTLMFMEENYRLGKKVSLVCKDDYCAVYNLRDQSGDGKMTCYQLFDGVFVLYNDFHSKGYESQLKTDKNLLTIDFCREGRIEWQQGDHTFLYLQAGDLYINTCGPSQGNFSFPLNHYHGITVYLSLSEAAEFLSSLTGITIDLHALIQKYCPKGKPFVMGVGGSAIGRIFSGFYDIPASVCTDCLKLKVLELLLYLNATDITPISEERPYFLKEQVGKAKAIQQFLISHLETNYSMESLAEMFEIPLTTMKRTFKGVYGSSIGAYLRAYRMNTAAVLLRQGDELVSVIAGRMGYDNASKFTAAFRRMFGMTPTEYRKSKVLPD